MDYFVTNGDLFQWDTGRTVTLHLPDGENCQTVEFTINNEVEALVVEVHDGVANIPNRLLWRSGTMHMWAVTVTADGRQTRRYGSAAVFARAKPVDYVYTEDEIYQWKKLEKRIEALEKAGGSSDIVIDTTLSVPGAAADAAVVGGKIEELSEAKENHT